MFFVSFVRYVPARDRLQSSEMRALLTLCFLAWLAVPAYGQATGTVQGVVVDTEGGSPLEAVTVRLQATGAVVTTDADGRFRFTGITAGEHDLYVSVVNFLLVTRRVIVTPDVVTDLTIALTQGTGRYTETVSVVGATPASRRASPAESQVGGVELQQLSGLLANDPLRAVQAMPGVTTGDDFRSEFAVRGAGPLQTGFVFEGVSTAFLLHTVQEVNDAGSIAMVNGDVLESVSLRSGSYPQRHGDRVGAEVEFQVREGSRDRLRAHASVSAVDASALAEGPLVHGARGSWLVAARKSYLDLVLKRLYEDQTVNFGFADVQGKLAWDVSSQHRLEWSTTVGRSRLDLVPDEVANPNDLRDAMNESAVSVLVWRYLPSPAFALTQRVAVAANTFRNTARDGPVLDDGATRDLVYRAEWTRPVGPRVTFDGGAEARWTQASGSEQRLSGTRLVLRERFDDASHRTGGWVSAHLRAGGLSFEPGVRLDRWSLTGSTALSPWLQSRVPIGKGVSLRAAGGIYRQAPAPADVVGVRGTSSLDVARSVHTDIGVEGFLRGALHWQLTAYNRQDDDWLRLPGIEPRVAGTLFVPVSMTTRWLNALDGHARGVEWVLERRDASGISGWVSYALGFSRYTDTVSGERFWGDFDQRHTVNAFATYRLSDRTSASARFRTGSNTPAHGYWAERDGQYFVTTERNELRTPGYARLDMRANRTFTRRQGRLTLYVELLNVLGRRNERFVLPGVNRRTLQAGDPFESMLPFVPSAGLLIEF